MSTEIQDYETVRAWLAAGDGTQRLLLGNGFSIAWKPDVFSYGSLFEQANFDDASDSVLKAFEALGTTDFEAVMQALRDASRLATVYGDDPASAEAMTRDIDCLREILATTIAASHPEGPFEVDVEQYVACRTFLEPFKDIYSANYDLLLYWCALHDEHDDLRLGSDDGFRKPADGPAEYVVWDHEKSNRTQNLHYLHGALHLFDAGHELQKYTWSGTGIRLIEQIRDALDRGMFPLIVTEGTANEKRDRILHSAYLARGLRSLASGGGSLTTYGMSFSPNDQHIIDAIVCSTVKRIGVSVFGDPTTEANRQLIDACNAIAERALHERSPQSRTVEIAYYDATSAPVWTSPDPDE